MLSLECDTVCMCMCVFQATEEGGETVACYSVSVSLVEGEETANSRWSVQRKLTEFQMLHRKLTEVIQHRTSILLFSIVNIHMMSSLYFKVRVHYC